MTSQKFAPQALKRSVGRLCEFARPAVNTLSCNYIAVSSVRDSLFRDSGEKPQIPERTLETGVEFRDHARTFSVTIPTGRCYPTHRAMLSDSEIKKLSRFISVQRESDTSPLDRLWAGRCAALLTELKQLQQRVEDLSREADSVLESKVSDTWVI